MNIGEMAVLVRSPYSHHQPHSFLYTHSDKLYTDWNQALTTDISCSLMISNHILYSIGIIMLVSPFHTFGHVVPSLYELFRNMT